MAAKCASGRGDPNPEGHRKGHGIPWDRGGPVPVPLRVGAPGKPLLRVSAAWHLVCDLALRVCVIVKVLVMVSILSVILSCLSYSPKEWAKRRDNPSGVPVL